MVTAEQTIEQKQDEMVFDGFLPPTDEDYFATLRSWRGIGAHIDSLAEFKVIEYILQLTWGNGNAWHEIPLTIEMFMSGSINEYGKQVDDGTGLCRQAVVTGLHKAIAHGLIVRQIEYWHDENGQTRATRYYGLRYYEPVAEMEEAVADCPEEDEAIQNERWNYKGQESDIAEIEQVNNLDFGDNQPVEPFYDESLNGGLSSNNSNNLSTDMTCNRSLRIQSQETLPERVNSNYSSKRQEKYPAFLRSIIKELSIELGDSDHIAPNISHATRLYKQSGLTEDQFIQLLYDLKALAFSKAIKKKNKQGGINRMPYVFACLTKSVAA